MTYDEPDGNLWGTIGKVLAGIGRAASEFGSRNASSSYTNQNNDLQLSEYHAQHIQKPKDIALQPIQQTQARNTTRNMINLVADINEKRHEREMRWAERQGKLRNLMDDVAKSQGLTSYEQFHKDRGVPYDLGSSITNTVNMADVVNLRGQSSGWIQEDPNLIARNLSHAQKPVTTADQLRMQQEIYFAQQEFDRQQELHLQQMDTLRAQQQAAQLRQQVEEQRQGVEQRNMLKGHLSYAETPPTAQEFFPASTYWNPSTQEAIDLNQKLVDGQVLTDAEIKQLILDLDRQHYSAETDVQKQTAEILEENTQNRIVESILVNAPVTEGRLVEVYGLELHPEEAELAVTLDVEHFWETETHLRPEEIQKALKDFAIEVWNFAYGEDIQTVLDNDAYPLARVWAGLQLLPAMKVTKLAKIGRFAKLFQKAGHLGANPFKGKTPTQIHKMLTRKGFRIEKEKYSIAGSTSYVNPKTGRSYNLDLNRKGGERLHVDVNYRTYDQNRNPIKYNKRYFKKKYDYEKRKYDL